MLYEQRIIIGIGQVYIREVTVTAKRVGQAVFLVVDMFVHRTHCFFLVYTIYFYERQPDFFRLI